MTNQDENTSDSGRRPAEPISLDFLGEGGEELSATTPSDGAPTPQSLAGLLASIPPPGTSERSPIGPLAEAALGDDSEFDQSQLDDDVTESVDNTDDPILGTGDTDHGADLPVTQLLADLPPPDLRGTSPASSPSLPGPVSHSVTDVRRAAVEWASRWKVTDDPYIAGITEAIDGRANLTPWAAMDPHELLPYPDSRGGRGLRRLTRVIIVLRNVTVFVPVALTWLAINMATAAYGPYLNTLPAGEQTSFLEFWQSGGADGSALDRFWRIQHVAFLDAVIIAGIVAATLLASTLEARSRVRSQRHEAQMESERRALAFTIAVGLQGSKSATPESITEALAFALADLMQAARDVATAASRMETASVGIDSLTPRVKDLNNHAAELGRSLSEDVNRGISDLGRSVATLGVTLGGDMQRFLTDVLVGLEEINDRLNRTSVSVEFGTKQLRDDLDAMHRSLAQLTGRRS